MFTTFKLSNPKLFTHLLDITQFNYVFCSSINKLGNILNKRIDNGHAPMEVR